MTTAELIRDTRQRAGITQRELAGRLGTSQPVVARWELGDSRPSLERLRHAVSVMGFELQFTVAETDTSDDSLISQHLSMSPRQRIDSLLDMLEIEETLHQAVRV